MRINLSLESRDRLTELCRDCVCSVSMVIAHLATLKWQRTDRTNLWVRLPDRPIQVIVSIPEPTVRAFQSIARKHFILAAANGMSDDYPGIVLEAILSGELITNKSLFPEPKTSTWKLNRVDIQLSKAAIKGLRTKFKTAFYASQIQQAILRGRGKPGLGFVVREKIDYPPHYRRPTRLKLRPSDIVELALAARELEIVPPAKHAAVSWAGWLLELWGLGYIEQGDVYDSGQAQQETLPESQGTPREAAISS